MLRKIIKDCLGSEPVAQEDAIDDADEVEVDGEGFDGCDDEQEGDIEDPEESDDEDGGELDNDEVGDDDNEGEDVDDDFYDISF
jgi:hypothetical protein